jgi:adenylate cyclase
VRLLPDIRYGTAGFPEKVARRLRALNMTTWIAAGVAASYSIAQWLDPTPDLWRVAIANAASALLLAAVPLLHRFGALAAPIGFIVVGYACNFVICALIGTASGMQLYYLVAAALGLLFVGTERILLAVAMGAVASLLMIVLEAYVPRGTGVQSAATMFGNYIGTAFASCGVLLIIVYYALREAARAEAAAEREHQRSESLLGNILPATIAGRLKDRTGAVIADRFDEASILFADMAGFTASASDTDPKDLVKFLNHVFTGFDRLVEIHKLEKIKTTGDSYMVVSGVPAARPDHAQALAQLALDMRDAATELRDPHGHNVPIRIGIASGPVVAGVVGTRKFFYDIWGDAVNVASRMESTGVPGKIQVSQETYEQLRHNFVLESRGPIEVKGKGQMNTWFLVGRQPRATWLP